MSKLNWIVIKNFIANLFGVGVNLVGQVLLVPIYLMQWSIVKYGDWIILNTLASVFSLSDAGFNTVTSNRFAAKYSEGDFTECRSLLANNLWLIIIASLIFVLIASAFLPLIDINSVLGIHVTSQNQSRWTFYILLTQIFIGMASGVLNTVYRATGKASKATFLDNLTRLVEFLVILAGIFLKFSFVTIAFAYSLPKVFTGIFKYIDTQSVFNYKCRLKDCDLPLMKSMLSPSIHFLAFPLGNAIIIQGFTLVVNKFFGAGPLVLFTTTRTLTNFIKSLMSTIAQAVWPEMSTAFGKNDTHTIRKLHRISLISILLMTFFAICFLLIFGNDIYGYWTKGKIVYDGSLMLAFLIVLAFNNLWYASSIVLMSSNRHMQLARLYVVSACLSIVLATITSILVHSLAVVALCLLIVDFTLGAYTIRYSLTITDDSIRLMYNQILSGVRKKYAC